MCPCVDHVFTSAWLSVASLSHRREIPTHRPRLLLVGERGQAHSSHVGPAVLHHLESLPVFVLDLPALYSVGVKSPEETCTQVISSAAKLTIS